MKKQELTNCVESFKMNMKNLLIEVLGLLNQGQRKKIFQNPEFSEICEKYGVSLEDLDEHS